MTCGSVPPSRLPRPVSSPVPVLLQVPSWPRPMDARITTECEKSHSSFDACLPSGFQGRGFGVMPDVLWDMTSMRSAWLFSDWLIENGKMGVAAASSHAVHAK